jgi:isoleucyl-tRNA synthetase
MQACRLGISLWGVGDAVPEGIRQHLAGAAAAIWTTTGWTIPANQAVAVNERLQYAVVEAQACTELQHMTLP